MKKLILLFATIAMHQLALAQESSNILPPSPQSQEFFKHFDFPANNPNGTINYSIPIYEVKSGSLSLPISLSYVSGGSKRADLPGEIGFNWSLNAGGRISRTIYGKPDDYKPFQDSIPYMNNGQGDYNTDYNYLATVFFQSSNYDSEFDMYSYSFGNTSGKFIYKQYDSNNQYNPKAYTIPKKPHKVDFGNIVDEKGITYRYETEELCLTMGPNYGWTTAKLLNYIISADKKDTIRIEYQQMATQLAINGGTMSQVKDNNTHSSLFNYLSPFYTIEQSVQSTNTYIVQTPKNIYFKGGKITFTMNSASDAIEYIKIYDSKNSLIKQFQLVRALGDGNLTELRLKDIYGTNVEKYAFEYYPHTRNEYQSDFLGYVKQGGWHVFRTGVSYSYCYREPIQNAFHVGSGSTTTANYAFNGYGSDDTAICGMLKKVTYPTGGTGEYSYGTNAIKVGFDFVNTGGMRLSQVKLTDNNGNVHYKTYSYGINDESGSGLSKTVYVDNIYGTNPDYTSYQTRVFPSGIESYSKRIYTSSILSEIAEAAEEATFYPTVTVYDGTPSNNTGKTVYNYNAPPNGSRYQIYQYPSANWGDFTSNLSEEVMGSTSSTRYHIAEFHLWRSSPLESMMVYKNNGSGYNIVKSIVNDYNFVETQKFKGLHILKNLEFGLGAYVPAELHVPQFLYDNYYITTGREDLLSTTETLYTPTGNVATTTSYEYNTHNQVSKTTSQESSGDTKITTLTYPTDYPGTQPYTRMITNNIISPVIEKAEYKNSVSSGTFLQSNKTDYSFWNYAGQPTISATDTIYPQLVSSRKGAGIYEPQLEYLNYDKRGNIASVHKALAPPSSYIWGYNSQYPIAQSINAPVNNVFHENFEDGAGNSTLNDAKTGHYSKTTSYAKSLTGLTAGDYTLRYWKKAGGVWTLMLSTVTVSGSTYSISISGDLLDDVCFYPVAAQMSTYTYDPLVGTTSATDARGEITYYEYDSYQRLMNVKDKDGNIVKHNDYHYKN